MTISSTVSIATGLGNGATTEFPFAFYAAASQLVVSLQSTLTGALVRVLGANEYTVDGENNSKGGTVSITAAPSTGQTVVIERVVKYNQPLDLVNQSGFYPDTIEAEFDHKEMEIQQAVALAERGLKVPKGEIGFTVAAKPSRVGFAGWDGDGNLTGVDLPSSGLGANITFTVDSRVIMAALPIKVAGMLVFLTEAGREGLWTYRLGAPPVADPLQGIYVSTLFGYFERLWDKVNARAEWFGAVSNDVSKAAANLLAFHAAKLLCTVTHVGVGEWYINDTLVLDVNTRRFQGAFMGIEGGPNGTRLVQTDNTKDIVRIGGESKAQSKALIEAMDFGVRWATDPVAPSDPAQRINAPKGFVYQHVLAFRSERCFVLDGLIGHFYHDTVNSKCIEPGFTRTRSLGANDFLVGHWVHGPASASGYAGGNATLFLRDLNVTLTQTGLAIDQPTGLYCDTDFADLFVDGIETSQINFGIVADGTGADYVNGHGDVHLRRLVFDQCRGDGIWVKNCHKNLKLHIDQFYIQLVDAGGNKGIHLEDNEFFVTIANGQIAGGADNTTTYGVYTNNQPNCIISETVIIESIGRPISLNGTADGGYIGANVGPGQANSGGTRAAVAVALPVGMIIEPNVRGPAGAWSEGILLGPGGSNTFVNPTRVDRVACADNRRLVLNGVQITTRGDYTAAGVASSEAAGKIFVTGYVG